MVFVSWPIHTNHCISIYRKYTEWSNAYEYTKYPILANHKVFIYENNNDYQQVLGMDWAVQTLMMITCRIDIRQTDKIIDENWNIYIARYIKHEISPYTDFYSVEIQKDGFPDKYW